MTGALTGKRVLIVEDEYFIAADLKRAFRREGAEVVGPVGNLEAGLSHAAEPIDMAVLDVTLEQALSDAIADRLRQVPFVFLTGYDGWSLPPEYQGDSRLPKPFAVHAVVTRVEELVTARRDTA